MEGTKTPPVKVGDIIEDQEVINSGKKNDGVIKYEGYIVFVNDCSKGETVSVRIDKVFQNFGIGTKVQEDGEE